MHQPWSNHVAAPTPAAPVAAAVRSGALLSEHGLLTTLVPKQVAEALQRPW